MLTRLWKTTKRFNKDARIEEHTTDSGEVFYSFRDRSERPFDIDKSEIDYLVKEWSMVEIDFDEFYGFKK